MTEIPLSQLRVFHAVARHLSYSRAGEELALSQPAVSRQISNLEDVLGLRLFDRRGRRVQLTDAGRSLYEYADQIVHLAGEARRAMDGLRNLERGQVRLGLAASAAGHALRSTLKQFGAFYPEIEVRLKVAPSRRIQQLLAEGALDLALAGPDVLPGLHIEFVLSDTLILVSAPEHPWATTPPPDYTALNGETVLWPPRGSGVREAVNFFLNEHGLQPATLEVPDWGAIRNLAAAGMGLAFVPAAPAAPELETGRLVQAGTGWTFSFSRCLLSAKDRPLFPAALAFANFARKHEPSGGGN